MSSNRGRVTPFDVLLEGIWLRREPNRALDRHCALARFRCFAVEKSVAAVTTSSGMPRKILTVIRGPFIGTPRHVNMTQQIIIPRLLKVVNNYYFQGYEKEDSVSECAFSDAGRFSTV